MVWTVLIFWIGAKLLPVPKTQTNFMQLLRVIGFSSSPGMIRFLGPVPGLTWVFFLAAALWSLAAAVAAVHQAPSYQGWSRPIFVCIVGWTLQAYIILYDQISGISLC